MLDKYLKTSKRNNKEMPSSKLKATPEESREKKPLPTTRRRLSPELKNTIKNTRPRPRPWLTLRDKPERTEVSTWNPNPRFSLSSESEGNDSGWLSFHSTDFLPPAGRSLNFLMLIY
jgi:hypothetical protein